ncbi:hypothetical protein NBRC116594_15680 [Shimia sp. NS0008-38b]|uniref:three-Cys-motif partner protein TcmP n=1 Tax=Shimia sp. NS0008-38b TaxID=3127653 RepID=UPI00310BB657
MQDLYAGREQSKAKHEIYARYLVPFATKILSTWRTIDVIDGFAGPWKNNDTLNLSDTSIGVSLRELSKVAEQQGHEASSPRIRCIYNEADPDSYQILKAFIERSKPEYPLLKLLTFEGTFEQNSVAIDRAADHQFRLLFVDPTGYSGFPPSCLRTFDNGRSYEIIVNMMRSFLERQATGGHPDTRKNLAGLLGAKRAERLVRGDLTIELVEQEYLKMLKEDLGFRFSCYSPIHNPDRDQIHFNLAYGTNHPEGLEVLRNAEFKALSDHDRTRFTKKVDQKGGDLFGDMFDEIEVRGPYLRARQEHCERVESTIRSVLIKHGATEFFELAAKVQEQLYLKRTEIGAAIVNMTKAEIVSDQWRQPRQRKPRHKDVITLMSS